jgi:hypothetical protein
VRRTLSSRVTCSSGFQKEDLNVVLGSLDHRVQAVNSIGVLSQSRREILEIDLPLVEVREPFIDGNKK